MGNLRKPFKTKVYVCVYVYKGSLFLDPVADLTTDCFMASLRCFVALYGSPSSIYSDNGSNFLGANTELQKLRASLQDSTDLQTIHQFAFCKGIKWRFIPSRAQHFGGLWEAAVRSMKTLLKKVMGEHVLRMEFRTLLLEASAVMNSRPLTAVDSHSPNMVEPMTPGHFLHGTCPSPLPLQTDVPTTCTYGKGWRLNQYLANKQEYLTRLQQRNKWKTKERNLQKGISFY